MQKFLPKVSMIEPKITAIPKLTVPAPTGVPHEFAESFAPTANERMNPKITANRRITKAKSF